MKIGLVLFTLSLYLFSFEIFISNKSELKESSREELSKVYLKKSNKINGKKSRSF